MLLVRAVVILLLGLAVGSFLNVLIDRIPKNLSILGRSRCDHCKKTLEVIDLVPVLSYLYLGGRCHNCQEKINIRNPIVELVTGALFVLTFIYVFPTSLAQYIELVYVLLIISSLIIIFFIDLKYQIIPDKIVYPMIVLSFIYLILNTKYLILPHLLSGFGASSFFLLLYLVTAGRGLGFGDVKLASLLGLFLGFPKILIAIYLAFLTGAAASVILILWRKKGLKDKIAFGPFLIAGGIIALFLGDKMVSRWLSFL